nr:PP2C family protein-serine/threonine phosphatase [Cellulomonas sp. JH27-2]
MLPSPRDLTGAVVRYRPADGRLTVGGDWFDVVELPGGRRGLVVGDCVGHGLAAAAVMGQLRSAARALLLEHGGPAATLSGLDRYARTLAGAEFTTVFVGVLDEAAGTFTHAAAGHLPPVLVTATGAEWVLGGRGTPLGLDGGERVDATAAVTTGDLLLLYTDGLVERRGTGLRTDLARLREHAPVLRDTGLDDAVDGLLDHLLTGDVRDDVVVLLCRVG